MRAAGAGAPRESARTPGPGPGQLSWARPEREHADAQGQTGTWGKHRRGTGLFPSTDKESLADLPLEFLRVCLTRLKFREQFREPVETVSLLTQDVTF